MSDDNKQDCKYGINCYQKNPAHKMKYRHPSPPPSETQIADKQTLGVNIIESEPESESESESKASTSIKRSISPNSDSNNSVKKSKLSSSPKNDIEQDSKSAEPTASDDPSDKCSTSQAQENITNSIISAQHVEISANIHKRDEADIKHFHDIFEKEIKLSQRSEYNELLKCSKMFIKYKFIFDMPDDFYSFWEFCKSVAKENEKPETVFEKFDLKLVGPFDVLAGKFDDAPIFEPGDYLRHWRFYYDPPEFQTVMVKKGSGIHYGYWRDEPRAEQCYFARNDYKKGCDISIFDTNIFNAVLYYLETDAGLSPFNRASCLIMKKALQNWATEKNINLGNSKDLLRKRNKEVVCKTFHGAGLVVPYDRKTEIGYRGLLENAANIKKILSKLDSSKTSKPPIDAVLEELQPIITAAGIAVDECDFGTPIELGIDLFCHGSTELHNVLRSLLIMGYSMVKRPHYIAIMKAHLENRRHGTELCILNSK